jgi:hypothetical protein
VQKRKNYAIMSEKKRVNDMAKVFLKEKIKTPDGTEYYEGYGIISDGKITYEHSGIITTVNLLENEIFVKRKSKDYEIHLPFQL